MPIDITQEKQQVQELIDRLAPNQVRAVRGLLEAMLDPNAHALANTAVDDEPASEEDRARFRNGKAWLAQRGGKGIPMEQVLAEFGLKLEDFPALSENAK
jgi:hypothetical protein